MDDVLLWVAAKLAIVAIPHSSAIGKSTALASNKE